MNEQSATRSPDQSPDLAASVRAILDYLHTSAAAVPIAAVAVSLERALAAADSGIVWDAPEPSTDWESLAQRVDTEAAVTESAVADASGPLPLVEFEIVHPPEVEAMVHAGYTYGEAHAISAGRDLGATLLGIGVSEPLTAALVERVTNVVSDTAALRMLRLAREAAPAPTFNDLDAQPALTVSASQAHIDWVGGTVHPRRAPGGATEGLDL